MNRDQIAKFAELMNQASDYGRAQAVSAAAAAGFRLEELGEPTRQEDTRQLWQLPIGTLVEDPRSAANRRFSFVPRYSNPHLELPFEKMSKTYLEETRNSQTKPKLNRWEIGIAALIAFAIASFAITKGLPYLKSFDYMIKNLVSSSPGPGISQQIPHLLARNGGYSDYNLTWMESADVTADCGNHRVIASLRYTLRTMLNPTSAGHGLEQLYDPKVLKVERLGLNQQTFQSDVESLHTPQSRLTGKCRAFVTNMYGRKYIGTAAIGFQYNVDVLHGRFLGFVNARDSACKLWSSISIDEGVPMIGSCPYAKVQPTPILVNGKILP